MWHSIANMAAKLNRTDILPLRHEVQHIDIANHELGPRGSTGSCFDSSRSKVVWGRLVLCLDRIVTNFPSSIDSALRKFFQPLKTGDTRADFFAVYRKESGEFDKDYTKKYDEDLNTSLIFVSLFLR